MDQYHYRLVNSKLSNFKIEKVSLIAETLSKTVLLVNENWIFQHAKTASAIVKIQNEVAVLEALKYVRAVPLTKIESSGLDFSFAEKIKGVPLRRDVFFKLTGFPLQTLAKSFAYFLKEMQRSNLSEVKEKAPFMTFEAAEKLYKDAEKEIFPHLEVYVRDAYKQLFDSFLEKPMNFRYSPVFIHGNLLPDRIVYNQHIGELKGIIGFEDAGAGDPAQDLATLIYHYGERFTDLLAHFYPKIKEDAPRARFFVAIKDLQKALKALESKNIKDQLAHLGSAKDLRN